MKTFKLCSILLALAFLAPVSQAQPVLSGVVSVAALGREGTASKVGLIAGNAFPISLVGKEITILGNSYLVTDWIDGSRLLIAAHFSASFVPYSAALPGAAAARKFPRWVLEAAGQ